MAWSEAEGECKDGTCPERGKKGKIRKEKKRKVKGNKKKNFKKEKIWHLPALVRQRESVEDGAHQLEHKDGTC